MMKMLLSLLLFCAALVVSVNGQKDRSETEIFSLPAFYFDVLNFSDGDSATTRVDVFVQVPFNKIQFVKSENGFRGEYSLTVSFLSEDKSVLLMEKMWNEKVEVTDFNQTMAKSNFNLSLRSFKLKPQSAVVRLVFEDKDSRKTYSFESPFTIRDFNTPITASDIILITPSTGASKGGKFIPNISRTITNHKIAMPIYYELYCKEARDVSIRYSVINQESQVILSKTEEKHFNAGKTQAYFTFDSLEYTTGEYYLRVTVLDDNLDELVVLQKKVTSRLPGLSFIIKDLDKAIDQMVYIATSAELQEIKDGKTYEEKLIRFLNYWKKKDPSAATEENEIFNEYYRRIEFCNKNFSHYMEGWRTDMGMVYVILGAPNNIDRHPFDYNSKPYEVWEYYDLNKKFVFVDATGFGDYRLVTPLYGDTYRFR